MSNTSPTPAEIQQFMQQAAAREQQYEAQLRQMREELRVAQQQANAAAAAAAQAAAHGPGPDHSASRPMMNPNANSAPSHRKIEIRPMQPTAFRGSSVASENAEQWLMEVERFLLISGISEEDPQRVSLASTYLKENASTWYNHATGGGNQPFQSWAAFRESFLKRFKVVLASKIARANIRKLRQRKTVLGYTNEFQRYMQNITDMSVTDQIETYLGGLHLDVAREVDKQQPQTLNQAIEMAMSIEVIQNGRGRGNYFAMSHSSSSPSSHGSGRHSSASGGDPMELAAMGFGFLSTSDQDFEMVGDTFGDSGLSSSGHWQSKGPKSGGSSEEILSQLAAFLHQNKDRRQGHKGQGQRKPRGPSGSGLSNEEYERLSKEGKCFKCKKTGHLARHCTEKSSSN